MEDRIRSRAIDSFRLGLIILLLLISILQTLTVVHFSEQRMTLDRILLAVALILAISYLWVQEVRSQQILQKGYERLLSVQDRMKVHNIETVRSLVLAEEAKDPYTSGHSSRVAEYSCLIAKRLGFGKEDLRTLENAAILHDIGKMGISDAILHKRGSLNKEEWKIIKKHPKLSVDILSPLDFLSKEREIIKHHHERYDGNGYPGGLKGEEIPIGSRIIAVADSYDAMKSARPYRTPLEKEAIASQFKQKSGNQFDPKVVDVLVELVKEGKEIF